MATALLLAIFLVYLLSRSGNKSSSTIPDRFYYNRSGRLVDAKTGRTCIAHTYDVNHSGHDLIIADSGAIVMDYTVKKAKDENKALSDDGKLYHWKEYKNLVSGKTKDYRSIWLPIDQATGRPYKLTKVNPYKATAERAYEMKYLDIPDRNTAYNLLPSRERRYLSNDQAQDYLYFGPGYKHF